MGGTNEKKIKEIAHMMTHDYDKKELSNVPKIDESQLPKVIVEQFKDVDIIKDQITQAKNRAEEAKKKSEELQKVGRFGGGKKAAIEDLQESAKMLATAQEQTVLAQSLFFEYQEKLAKATKWLFELGVNNAANTETIIRQLEIYLEGGSADELDELKQSEINAVIDRLLQQEDMQQKQKKMSDLIDSMDLELAEQHKINEQQAAEIKSNKEKNDEQDKLIATQAKKDEEHDKLLAESKKKDEEQDRELKLQAKKDEEHDRLLAKSKKKDEEQDEEIHRQAKNDERHDLLFEKQKEINDSVAKEMEGLSNELSTLQNSINEMELQKGSKSMNIVSLVIAIAALGLSIAQFFM